MWLFLQQDVCIVNTARGIMLQGNQWEQKYYASTIVNMPWYHY